MMKHPITEYRETNGLTLEAFGALLSQPADKSTVLRWEAGAAIPVKRLAEVARITGTPVEALLPKESEAAQ
jgi:transcriptional regulator with XRE-family HTH domain